MSEIIQDVSLVLCCVCLVVVIAWIVSELLGRPL